MFQTTNQMNKHGKQWKSFSKPMRKNGQNRFGNWNTQHATCYLLRIELACEHVSKCLAYSTAYFKRCLNEKCLQETEVVVMFRIHNIKHHHTFWVWNDLIHSQYDFTLGAPKFPHPNNQIIVIMWSSSGPLGIIIIKRPSSHITQNSILHICPQKTCVIILYN